MLNYNKKNNGKHTNYTIIINNKKTKIAMEPTDRDWMNDMVSRHTQLYESLTFRDSHKTKILR